MNLNKKIFLSIGITIIFIVAGFSFAYMKNLPFIDPLLSSENRDKRKFDRVQSYFPETIENYKLFSLKDDKIEINERCNKIEDNPILKESGRTGDACMETFMGEYREPVVSTSSIVRISLSRFTKAPEMFELLVEKTTSPEILNGKNVLRLTPLQLSWSPASMFDLIVTQESIRTVGTSSIGARFEKTESVATTTGNNAVTQYFLSKYSPR